MEGLGIVFLAAVVLLFVFLFFSFIPVGLWISAWAAGVRVPLLTLVEAMRAKLVEAQAQVPLALAEALRKGHLGVMDYYRLKNIEADTDMRESISRAAKPEGEE